MTDAPREIWLDADSEDDIGMFVCEGANLHENMDTRYIRADDPAMAARVLLEAMDESQGLRNQVWQATGDAPGEFGKWFAAALRTIAEEG